MNKSQDIFGIKHIPVTDYQVCLKPFSSGDNSFKISTVNPTNPNVLMNVAFKCTLPEIRGIGKMKYCDYLGYQLIKSVSIYFHAGGRTCTLSSSHIFDSVCALPNASRIFELAGHCDTLRSEVTSQFNDECLKPSYEIIILVPLPFGQNFPHNILKQPAKTEIDIAFNLRPITELLDANDTFKMPIAGLSISEIQLDVLGIYIPNDQPTGPLVSVPSESKLIPWKDANETKREHDKYKLTKHVSLLREDAYVTHLKWRPVVDFSKLQFLCLYNNWHTPAEGVDNFVKSFLNEIVIVTDKTLDELKADYPSGSAIDEVNNLSVVITQVDKTTGLTFNKKVSVIIDRLPLKGKVYFHKNLLVNSKLELNLSEKIHLVKGFYHDGKLVFEHVDHSITSNHACLPLQAYDINNRKRFSPCMNMKRYYLSGFNFLDENISDFKSAFLYSDKTGARSFAEIHPSVHSDTNRFHLYRYNFDVDYYKLECKHIPADSSVDLLFDIKSASSDKLERKYAEINRNLNYTNHYDSGMLSLLTDQLSLEVILYGLSKLEGNTELRLLPFQSTN
jgi:hypothetical protein